ncbi:MAG TPA: hypothetical protein VMU96_14715, partial [Casimicrobiaceae bacterium]|nr:hypothetical protein [Casimicrobiaceae bacterium]
TVRVTAITQGTGANSIALADNNARFGWTGTTLAGGTGTAGQPTIFALNQLYSSCGSATQAVPAAFWSYNTGSGAIADLSPVMSFGGDQVAFVQSSSGVASLVLLKWSSTASVGTVGAPTAPNSVTPANYRACTAPCMTVIAFNGNPDDSNSSPFYDYAGDIVYVGADNGTLHKFTGVFNGTPAEQTTGGFPATVSTGNVLTSPVYDSVSGLVFVGSSRGATTGGALHTINASGTVVTSGQLAGNNTPSVADAPLVDSTAGMVYVFVANDGSTTANSPTCYAAATSNCTAVYQFPTNFAGGSTGTKTTIGGGINPNRVVYAGTFDDTYWNSSGSSPTGYLYVCGGATTTTPGSLAPTLWRVPIVANVMGTAQIGPQLVSGALTALFGRCSPVAEVANGSNDFLFVSVPDLGNGTGCGGAGCVNSFQVGAVTTPNFFDTTTTSSSTNNAARYMSVSASATLNGTETNRDTILTAAQTGVYSGMIITQGAATPAGTTNTYTLRNNYTSTSVVCSIPAGSTTCSDSTHSSPFPNVGDAIDVLVQKSAGGTNLTTTYRVQLTYTGTPWAASTAATAGIPAAGGAGGIIIDNISSTTGASQVYYSTVTSPGNAVQASQAALQ